MKRRSGLVSNSSSTSFVINNNTGKNQALEVFTKEAIHLADEYRKQYGYPGCREFTNEELIASAAARGEVLAPRFNIMTFGDEEGDLIGRVYDYILRDGGSTKNFSWSFYEFHR